MFSKGIEKFHYISTTTVSMTTKLGYMVIYIEGILPKQSYDP